MSSTKKNFGSVRQIVSKVASGLGGGNMWFFPPTKANPDFKSLWFKQNEFLKEIKIFINVSFCHVRGYDINNSETTNTKFPICV